MRVRVLRLMEYIYDSPERMEQDMGYWQVHGTRKVEGIVLKSAVLTPEFEKVGDPFDGDSNQR